MAPVCSRHIDPYPQPNPYINQTQTQYFHPNPPVWGSIPPHQVKIDQSEPHVSYNPWSYGSNYGYPYPWECHSCGQHGPHPAYYGYRPPYSHFPQPPLVCYHGPCRPCPESFTPYHVPYSHYAVEQPRCEYDKNTSSENLCSRCLNKVNLKDSSGVKIEEHEPEVEKMEGKENESFGPMELDKSHPYPIVWIPSDYINRESNKLPDTESSGLKLGNGRSPFNWRNDRESSEPSKLEPKAWNGWFPLDFNNIKSLMQDGDAKSGNQDKRSDKKEQFPFPIIWVPATGKQDDTKNGTDSPKTSDDQITIPAKRHENCEPGEKKGGGRSISSSSKGNIVKEIPVKENEQYELKEVKRPVEIKEKESKDENGKRKSTSPSKDSKLPPICLRVDPMPKKKHGNGSSRSPSPPSNKRKVCETSSANDRKKEASEDSKGQGQLQARPEENYAKEEKIRSTEGEKAKLSSVADTTSQVHTKVGAPGEGTGKAATGKEETPMVATDGDKRTSTITEDKTGQEKKEKKCLSELDAAVTIQAAYRGYEVRRWEPLKKLKQIATVREQVKEVRRRVEALASSIENEKQRLAVGETIMNLLLRLDTIQGLHPSVRDARKSVARELVSLQEKLDSLFSRKEVSECGEMSLQDRDEHELRDSSEKSKETEHAINHIQGSGQMEPEHQLGMSSSILGDVCVANKEEQVEFVNSCNEAPIVNGKAVEPELNDSHSVSPSASLKDEETNTGVEVQNEKKEVQVSPEEPVGCSCMIAQKPDPETEGATGTSDKVKVCQPEGETKSIDENAKNEKVELRFEEAETNPIANVLLEDREDEETNMKSLTDQAREKIKMIEEQNEEAINVEPVESALMELPIDMADEMASENDIEKIIQFDVEKKGDLTENLKLQEEKDERSDLGAQFDESNPQETRVQQLTEEENCEEVAIVSKKGEPEEVAIVSKAGELEKGGLVEEPLEVHDISFSCENDVCNFNSKFAESAGESQVDRAITLDKNEEYKTMALAEIKDSDSSVSTNGETGESTFQTLALETVEDPSVHMPHIEEEDTKVINSDGNQESIAVKQELVKDSAPINVGPLANTSNVIDVSPNDPPLCNAEEKKLVEENEKLREMLEKLMEAGKQQFTAISELHGRVRDLEKKMSRKKRMRIRHNRRDIAASNVSKREAVSCAM